MDRTPLRDNDPYSSFSIVYSNCQKSRASMSSINVNSNIDSQIIALTEPWLGPKGKGTFMSPWSIHHAGIGSRACLVTPPWCNAFVLSSLSHKDAIFCRISIKNFDGIIGTMYSADNHMDVDNMAATLLELQSISPNVLILCDTNAHSTLWGYQKSNQKGKQWEEVLSLSNMEVFTQDFEVTFRNSRGFTSCIDVAFGTPEIKNLFSGRQNEIFPTVSDHTIWSLNSNIEIEESMDIQYKLKSVDWDTVRSVCDDKLKDLFLPDIPTKSCIDTFVDNLTEIIQSVMDSSIAKSYRKPSKRWWNSHLTLIQNQLKEAKSTEHRNELQQQLKKEMELAQAKDWRTFASSCANISDVFLRNKLLNMDRKICTLHPIKRPNGSLTTSSEETITLLLKEWFDKEPNDEAKIILQDLTDETNSYITDESPQDFSVISDKEIALALAELKPYSAPGWDNIPAIFLQEVSSSIIPHLNKLFNAILVLSHTPVSWKKGKVILIPKPGTNTACEGDYRPITLLPIMAKVLEKVILRRMQNEISTKNWFSHFQYAFLPGKSVNQALFQYSTKVSSALKGKQPCIALHLDIKGAFNSVRWPLIIKRLKSLNCPNYLICWIMDYLQHRTQFYASNSTKAEVNVTKSTPQGGSLSPILWNVLINPLVEVLSRNSSLTLAFADDLAVFIEAPTWDQVQSKANRILKIASNWAKENLVEFNPTKSEYIIYTWSRQLIQLEVLLDSVKLKRVNKVKYLGVVFTEKLTWKAHAEYVSNKAIRIIHSLSNIVRRHWGLKGKYMRTLYLGAIEPILTHGCIAWAQGISKKSILKKFIRIQRMAALQITFCNRNTHYLDLLALAGITPIELRLSELSFRTWASIITDVDNPCKEARNEWNTHSQHGSHFSALEQCYQWSTRTVMNLNRSSMVVEKQFSAIQTKLKEDTPNGLINIMENEMDNNCNDNQEVQIFTDGSKSEFGVGIAIVKIRNGLVTESWASSLHPDTSIYKAELTALEAAVQLAKHDESTGITILSDALALLKALRSPSQDWKVEKLRNDIIGLNSEKQVKLKWIRGHMGTYGNELADQYAKAIAITRPTVQPFPLSKQDLTNISRLRTKGDWQDLWNSRCSRETYKWIPEIKKKMRLEDFPNDSLAILNNFCSDNSPLNRKLHLWNIRASSNCLCQVEAETTHHFLFKCSRQAELRRTLKCMIQAETGRYELTHQAIWNSESCLRILAEAVKKRLEMNYGRQQFSV